MIRPEDMDDIALIAEYQRWVAAAGGAVLMPYAIKRMSRVEVEFNKRMQEDEECAQRRAESAARWRAELGISNS